MIIIPGYKNRYILFKIEIDQPLKNSSMPAYIIVDVKINNAEMYEEYKKLTPASIAATVENLLSAVVQPKLWKEIGNPAAL